MSSTSFTDGVTQSAAAWANDVDTAVYNSLSAVSGTNTVTATGPVSMTAYASGQRFLFIPANTNTGAATLNITPSGGAALGAKNIFANGAALAGNELVSGQPVLVGYDGTRFHVIGPNAQVNGTASWAAAAGTVNAITATYAPAIVTLVDGMVLGFRATGANTSTAPTFSPNGLTARAITEAGGSALELGAIYAANYECFVRYNLANTRWELLNPFPTQNSSFTASLTGCTAGVTGTVVWYKTGSSVTAYIPALTGTSNTTACTITGLPAAITPATTHTGLVGITQDNSATPVVSRLDITSGGVITLYSGQSTTFTNANVKGLPAGATLTWNLN